MLDNQLHINLTKCSYMHFRPQHSIKERLTCARTREYGTEPVLKIRDKKLKKVDRVKFLGVIIDDKLNWDAQIDHLVTKLNSSIVVIKRIKKFIPESEYTKLYNALFKSHMTYCISCWGGISSNKLQKVFYIQKRCIRLLFGKEYSFDHAGFYETCARTRTYEENMTPKNYCLEHTKPLFNEYKILNVQNLYALHTFVELFKITKYHTPISIFNLFTPSPRDTNFLFCPPKVHLSTSRANFVFRATLLWNSFIGTLLNKCTPGNNGIVIPGSTIHSDMSASVKLIKTKLKDFLIKIQSDHDSDEWIPKNFHVP